MKVVLINPPWYSPLPQKFQTSNLGLSYLAAFFREKGHTIIPIDALFDTPNFSVQVVPIQFKYQQVYLVGIPYSEIVNQIPKDTDLIGIAGPTTNHAQILRELSAEIKKKYPNTKILIGGPYPSTLPEDIPSLSVDFAINGEPEVVLKKYLEGVPLKEIKGLIFKEGEQWIFNGKAELPEDLDSIPFPARDVFHCNELIEKDSLTKRREGAAIITDTIRSAPIVLSRGCPHGCRFCSISIMNGKKWRHRSPENIIKEMIELRDKYNVEEVVFLDDHLIGDRAYFMNLMNLMISQNIGLSWNIPNGVRVDYLNDEILQKMKEAGCNLLVLGIQSGSKKMINLMNTGLNLEKVEPIVKQAHTLGLKMAAFLIIGYPGESRKDFFESITFCKNLRKFGLKEWVVNVARAYPKTYLDTLCQEKGYFVYKDTENLFYFPRQDYEANIQTPEFTPSEVIWRRDYAVYSLLSEENPFYWKCVYYLEKTGCKKIMKKIIPSRVWDKGKGIMFNTFNKLNKNT
ncbi:MAG: radical SAM protein [Candidatus Woesearchaeota archaeon]|jgi:magnesium-protoporphyrin IX monomethyl ester (oxidative) cyclase